MHAEPASTAAPEPVPAPGEPPTPGEWTIGIAFVFAALVLVAFIAWTLLVLPS